ncbi:transmembrane protein 132C-like [Notothenia coriiceps]|uniref:Transmembrane protein 132C-like n=1 Tax=Notothenia coriiceps TaxID=8208 RepID=A0A6I9PEV4_9TELE|nr:PREDICTED: transmembrane protein 132C-like [Notothenia coriiceps]
MRQRRRILCNKRNGGVARNTAVFFLNGELLTEDKLRAKLCGFLLKELSSGISPLPRINMGPRRDMGLFLCVGITALLFLCTVVDSKVILEGLQRYGPTPIYLPVNYQIFNAESAFFLQEANQDLMRNSSLQARTESFFIHQARQMPFVNASYGPLSVQQPVPLDLLQTLPGPFNPPTFDTSSAPTSASSSSPPLFTFNWKVHTYIISDRIHPSWPKVQVLFYIAGRDWDDYSAIHKLPCVRMFAFHETQEVRGTCRLKGELGICVAELEPLASWFSLPTVRPGRQRVSEQAQGTPVELYYMVQTTGNGDCNLEDSRKGSSVRPDQQRPMGYYAGHTPMQRIGSVRLFQPLSELKLDNNFVVMSPSKPIRQRETVSTFLALSTLSLVPIFTLRSSDQHKASYYRLSGLDKIKDDVETLKMVKLKDGVAFLGARASNPVVWTVSQEVRSEGHRVVTLHCRRKESSYSQRRRAKGLWIGDDAQRSWLRIPPSLRYLEGSPRPLRLSPSVVTWCSTPCLVVSAEKVGSDRSGNSAKGLRKMSSPDSEPDSPSYAALPSVHTREENVKASTKRLFLMSTNSP